MRLRGVVVLAAAASLVTAAVTWSAGALLTSAAATLAAPRSHAVEDDDFGTADVYTVEADGALSPAPATRAADVWDMFVGVVTPEFAAASMAEYRVGDAPDSETMAYVHRADDPAQWVLAANLAYADDRDILLSTLVHEYGHILSLDVDEVDPDERSCDTWETSEGCVRAGTALYDFDAEFWLPYGDEAPTPEDDDSDAAADFYAAHEDDFVSDYAATNVIEDFAETFMTFVLEPEPASDADSPVARKLDFFWALPDYVAERDRIRAEFTLD